MTIVALNCGSSSIKSAAFVGSPLGRVLSARIEDIGTRDARLCIDGEERAVSAMNIESGAKALLAELSVHLGNRPLTAVVHRIVHGSEHLSGPTLIDDAVLNTIDELSSLAPLHNPPAAAAVRAARAAFNSIPHFAVFDTSFHATLPPRAREYALSRPLRGRYGIRRYGFHGISHEHVMQRVAAYLKRPAAELRIISCHLGNGSSMTAIEYGRSVETSMGMTPLEGLVMGTRAGDLDSGVTLQLMKDHDRSEIETILTRNSGLLGMTGTNDMRDIERRAADGDEDCRLALNVYSHRIRKYIGAYAATMGGVDAIAFTGGVGENSALIRHRCMQRLDFLGATLDEDLNRDALQGAGVQCSPLSAPGSRVQLLALRADEELAMAQAIVPLLRQSRVKAADLRIPVAVSARHAHLSQPSIDALFGAGYQLKPKTALSQTGQFAAQESIALIGPRGRLEKVRLMGPARSMDQVEISRSDEFALGVDAPVRISGDLANSPGITVEGPKGRITLASGLIAVRRHIHMSDADAMRFGVRDHDVVAVRVDSDGRDLVFNDVTVRISPSFTLELHLDTDEANAAGLKQGDFVEMVRP